MLPPEVIRKRDALRGGAGIEVRWCDDDRLEAENAEGVSPGGYLNRFGWYVVGTTIGGNAIVVNESDERVYFADHTWYSDDLISYQLLGGDRSWVEIPLTADGVRASLFSLAASVEDYRSRAAEVDRLLDSID